MSTGSYQTQRRERGSGASSRTPRTYFDRCHQPADDVPELGFCDTPSPGRSFPNTPGTPSPNSNPTIDVIDSSPSRARETKQKNIFSSYRTQDASQNMSADASAEQLGAFDGHAFETPGCGARVLSHSIPSGRESSITKVDEELLVKILPYDTVQRLHVDPKRCILSKVCRDNSRCLKTNHRWTDEDTNDIIAEWSKVRKPLTFERFQPYIKRLISKALCTGGHHQCVANENLQKLLTRSLTPITGNNHETQGSATFNRADQRAIDDWVASITSPATQLDQAKMIESQPPTPSEKEVSQSTDQDRANKVEPQPTVRSETEVLQSTDQDHATIQACTRSGPNLCTNQPDAREGVAHSGTKTQKTRLLGSSSPTTTNRRQKITQPQLSTSTAAGQKFVPFSTPQTDRGLSIQQILLREIEKPLGKTEETEAGYIYFYWVGGEREYVKIGFTRKVPDERLKQWKSKCGQDVQAHTYVGGEQLTKAESAKIPHVYRVERLAHKELSQFRHREPRCVKCSTRETQRLEKQLSQKSQRLEELEVTESHEDVTQELQKLEKEVAKISGRLQRGVSVGHNEWFQVKLDIATKVVQKWAQWMVEQKPYESRGADGKPQLRSSITVEDREAICTPCDFTKPAKIASPSQDRKASQIHEEVLRPAPRSSPRLSGCIPNLNLDLQHKSVFTGEVVATGTMSVTTTTTVTSDSTKTIFNIVASIAVKQEAMDEDEYKEEIDDMPNVVVKTTMTINQPRPKTLKHRTNTKYNWDSVSNSTAISPV